MQKIYNWIFRILLSLCLSEDITLLRWMRLGLSVSSHTIVCVSNQREEFWEYRVEGLFSDKSCKMEASKTFQGLFRKWVCLRSGWIELSKCVPFKFQLSFTCWAFSFEASINSFDLWAAEPEIAASDKGQNISLSLFGRFEWQRLGWYEYLAGMSRRLLFHYLVGHPSGLLTLSLMPFEHSAQAA